VRSLESQRIREALISGLGAGLFPRWNARIRRRRHERSLRRKVLVAGARIALVLVVRFVVVDLMRPVAARAQLRAELGREPTPGELHARAEMLRPPGSVTLGEIRDLLRRGPR